MNGTNYGIMLLRDFRPLVLIFFLLVLFISLIIYSLVHSK